jgi:hypothetical protein
MPADQTQRPADAALSNVGKNIAHEVRERVISQLVLVEDRLPRGDHLFQDIVQELHSTISVPNHKPLNLTSFRQR